MRYATVSSTLLFLLGACSDAPTEPARAADELAISASHAPPGIPSEVIVSFGRDDVGTDYFPGEHDASYHGKDRIRPRLVHLAAGGNVIFQMGSFHSVAVYGPGSTPADVEVSEATLEDVDLGFIVLPDILINDPSGRLAWSELSLEPMVWSPPPGTFDEPGRYLVICAVAPHFIELRMYAWIEVL